MKAKGTGRRVGAIAAWFAVAVLALCAAWNQGGAEAQQTSASRPVGGRSASASRPTGAASRAASAPATGPASRSSATGPAAIAPQVQAQLAKLADKDPNVRQAALASLAKVRGVPAVTGAVVEATKDRDSAVAVRALTVLGSYSDADHPLPAEHIAAVLAAADNFSRDVRMAAVTVLGQIGPLNDAPAEVYELLLSTFQRDPVVEVRAAAAASLAAVNWWGAVPSLLAGLEDSNSVVRRASGAALIHILGADYGFRADDPPDKRAVAVEKLRKASVWIEPMHKAFIQRIRDRKAAETQPAAQTQPAKTPPARTRP